MSVVIETTLGDITVDLFVDQRPQTCMNFLKLCKMKYYNFNLFHTIQNGFIAQTGDPTGEGSGGQSIWGILHGTDKRYFSAEKVPKLRHSNAGLLSMVCSGDAMVGSQFFFTLGPDLDSLDGIHCVIGEVTEGHDILRKLNDTICDESHRPYQDVRITHTVILEDPFNDPPNFREPSRSPSPSAERLAGGRIAPDEDLDETQGKSAAEIQELIEEKEAKARATILEIVGDLPDAEIAPPENVLFVCKLNPVTSDDDLEILFSRFGKIVSCEVIRDKKSGDSLQYAFIEFADKKSCEDAYFKMDNVLIDDRRIHVDFSQSVSKIKWLGKGRGVKHFTDDEIKSQKRYDDKTHKHSNSIERDRNERYKRHTRTQNQSEENAKKREHTRRSRSRSNHRHRNHRSRDKHVEHSKQNIEKKSHRSPKRSNNDRKNDNFTGDKRYNDDGKYIYESQSNRFEELPKEINMKDKSYERYKREGDLNGSQVTSQSNKKNVKKKSMYREDINSHQKINNKMDNKNKQHEECRTPSPKEERGTACVIKNKNENKTVKNNSHKKTDNSLKKKKDYLKKKEKKKRKPSTSSSSDTSESSSSTESSTSSDSDYRKKRNRKKKKRLSTSSSSSSTSSSTSSSSSSTDSSSESSTSSSSSSVDHRYKKVQSKKTAKKSKTSKK